MQGRRRDAMYNVIRHLGLVSLEPEGSQLKPAQVRTTVLPRVSRSLRFYIQTQHIIDARCPAHSPTFTLRGPASYKHSNSRAGCRKTRALRRNSSRTT